MQNKINTNNNNNMKLKYDNEIVNKGDVVVDGDGEEGVIVDIDFENKVVSLYDCKEGWYVSEENENMGSLSFES
jgi:hypothetical protein